MNLSTSYLVRLYPHSDSGVAHDLKLFAIVGGITTKSPLTLGSLNFNDIVGRMRLEGLVHQLGNVIVIESGHFDR
jgi:hypothetical protein